MRPNPFHIYGFCEINQVRATIKTGLTRPEVIAFLVPRRIYLAAAWQAESESNRRKGGNVLQSNGTPGDKIHHDQLYPGFEGNAFYVSLSHGRGKRGPIRFRGIYQNLRCKIHLFHFNRSLEAKPNKPVTHPNQQFKPIRQRNQLLLIYIILRWFILVNSNIVFIN